jgi:uncharacterized membrane protein
MRTDRQEHDGGTNPGRNPLKSLLNTERLSKETRNFLNALAERALKTASEKLTGTTERVVERLEGGGPGVKSALSGATALVEGKSPVRAALKAGMTGLKEKVKGLFRRRRGKKAKLTNIVESTDVGAPLRLTFNQWSQFEDFPNFTKGVEHAERGGEGEKVSWKAKVWWFHRAWESSILEHIPDNRIVWRTTNAQKGRVDGAVSFSELAPNSTRVLLVVEYHPQGFIERIGNIWRAVGRRIRLDFKHFRRHVMVHAILNPEEITGWRGEIREGEIVKTHEDAVEEEERAREEEEAAREEEPAAGPEEEAEPEEEEAPAAEREEAAEEEPEREEAEEAEEAPAAEREEAAEEAAEEEPQERRRRRRPPVGRARARRRETEPEEEEGPEREEDGWEREDTVGTGQSRSPRRRR